MGDDLILHYDDRLWTYNLSFGGLSVAANHVSTGAGECAKVFGNQVFVAGIGASDMVERTDIDAYDTSEGTLDSGRFDMGYPGIDKVLTKIVVTAEPLPANTQIEVAYSIEGAAFVTVSDTWDTDNETSHTFTVSTSGSSVVGKDFEIRLLLNSTDSSATPTVKSVTAEAISAESRTEYQLEIDAGSIGDGDRATAAALDTLATLAATRTLTTFVDPWGTVEEYEAGVSKTVRVLAVEVPEVGAESQAFATVILREE
ncbi:MAG: hypothetical protein DWQ40_00385 [Actinobacteria bacterium]|nr:MAG: hypothetical protein DWQ40_00385 [Actinomycetota bacterium]REK35573.1 MAG: hypothetical protein DWQ20_06000 [Actinomycetota bacterium]